MRRVGTILGAHSHTRRHAARATSASGCPRVILVCVASGACMHGRAGPAQQVSAARLLRAHKLILATFAVTPLPLALIAGGPKHVRACMHLSTAFFTLVHCMFLSIIVRIMCEEQTSDNNSRSWGPANHCAHVTIHGMQCSNSSPSFLKNREQISLNKETKNKLQIEQKYFVKLIF
jgi:hypothetical protein